MRIDCVSPIRPLYGIYKSAPRWRKSANDGSKTSCALPHRSRGQVSVGFHGIKSKSKSQSKIQAKTPQEVKTTPSQDDLDLVKGLKRLGQALHAPKLPRSAGIPDSLTTCTAARRVAFARFASLRSVDDSGRGLRPRTTSSARSRTSKSSKIFSDIC